MRRSVGIHVAAVLSLTLSGACTDGSGGGTGGGGGAGGRSSQSTTTSSSASSSASATTIAASTSGATSAGGGAGEGGAGAGAPDPDKDPSEVESADDCFYEGFGGDDGFHCAATTVTLSSPIPVDELTFFIVTSEGHELDTATPASFPEPGVRLVDDPVTALQITVESPPPHYAPTWIDVEVRREDLLVGAARFETLEYQCYAHTEDNWCWEADPVVLEIDR